MIDIFYSSTHYLLEENTKVSRILRQNKSDNPNKLNVSIGNVYAVVGVKVNDRTETIEYSMIGKKALASSLRYENDQSSRSNPIVIFTKGPVNNN